PRRADPSRSRCRGARAARRPAANPPGASPRTRSARRSAALNNRTCFLDAARERRYTCGRMSLARVKGKNVDIHLWAHASEVEPAALDQLRNVAALPWVFHHVAAMADVHLGAGATVGSVIAMKDAVSPAAVGVDIGCGMSAVRTNLAARDLPDGLHRIRMD